MLSWLQSRRTDPQQPPAPQADIPLATVSERTARQEPPDDPLAAAYFGESSKLFFGPHFITNAASLNPSLAGSGGGGGGGGGGAVTAAGGSGGSQGSWNPFNWYRGTTTTIQSSQLQEKNVNLNLERRLTEDELIEISKLYRQTPLGDVNLTCTLQSLTNLRKTTLKMTAINVAELSSPTSVTANATTTRTITTASVPPPPSPTETTKHLLEFTFDCSTPCLIRIHYVSKEVLVLQPDGTKKLAFAPKHWRTLSSRQNSDLRETAITTNTKEEGGSIAVDGDHGVPMNLAVKDWPQLASKMAEKPVVKTYGPFGAGLGQKFVVPEVDAFDSSWFSKEELTFGSGVQSPPVAVAAAPAGAALEPTTTTATTAGTTTVQITNNVGDGSERINIPNAEADVVNPTSTDVESTTDHLLMDGEAIYYPMVIVMEAFTDGNDPGSFQEANEKATNIQITYASLVENRDQSSYSIKVLKQKVLIDGTPYLLQEIFGYTDPTGTGASNPNLQAEDLQTMRECVVCMSELKDTIVLPCRHLCLCHSCGETLRMQGRNANGGALGSATAPKCPICRQTFESLLQISLPAPLRQGIGSLSQQSSMAACVDAPPGIAARLGRRRPAHAPAPPDELRRPPIAARLGKGPVAASGVPAAAPPRPSIADRLGRKNASAAAVEQGRGQGGGQSQQLHQQRQQQHQVQPQLQPQLQPQQPQQQVQQQVQQQRQQHHHQHQSHQHQSQHHYHQQQHPQPVVHQHQDTQYRNQNPLPQKPPPAHQQSRSSRDRSPRAEQPRKPAEVITYINLEEIHGSSARGPTLSSRFARIHAQPMLTVPGLDFDATDAAYDIQSGQSILMLNGNGNEAVAGAFSSGGIRSKGRGVLSFQ
ncbi:hypothetical protein BDR26DRAFT_1009430 [Obelidium mucronatum]|nr:hypothetical protein BDR26DRAFT_1009430 [Obelidium mucronatum]